MEGNVDTDLVRAVEEPDIPSAAATGPGPAESMASGGSGGGDGSAASCRLSLTHELQVQNLKENWKRAFNGLSQFNFDSRFEESGWFAEVVAKLRIAPRLDTWEFEIDKSLQGFLFTPEFRMTSLDLAILMGDLKMVQEIFERSSFPDNLIRGSLFSNLGGADSLLYTPLHLAVSGGDSHIVDALLEKHADVNAQNRWNETPLDLACKKGNLTMLQQLLAKDRKKKDPFHVAVRHGDVDFVKKLPSLNVNAEDHLGKTPLHYLAAERFPRFGVTNIVQYLAQDKALLNLKALDSDRLSAFYVAVLFCNTEFVIALLESFKDQIRLNEACNKKRGPPIQIAFEGGDDFKDIERALMECDPVKGYMDTLYRDRQVYVDAANAILVGAALIASVTFASWLQPPLNYTSYSTSDHNYVDVEHNIALRAFWVFNALSFYFAIGTVVCGALSVLPRSRIFIKKTVEKLRTNLLVTSILLACSVLFVIIAFAIAGTIVLTPLVKYRWFMIGPTLVGGMVCIISLGFLVKSMAQNYFIGNHDDFRARLEPRDYFRCSEFNID